MDIKLLSYLKKIVFFLLEIICKDQFIIFFVYKRKYKLFEVKNFLLYYLDFEIKYFFKIQKD